MMKERKRTNRRILIWVSGAGAIASAIGMSGCRGEQAPMNVIYILADDLGYGDLGCYGQQIIQTPHLDRMAAEGLLFTQHYSGAPVSAPSRCSLLTGLHTGHAQIRGNREVLPEGQAPMQANTFTLGKLMQSAGYATGMFGKWGLGYPGSESVPNKMGFDHFFGYNCQRQSHTYFPTHLFRDESKIFFPENERNSQTTYSEQLIHQEALAFIRANKDRPFFAMLTYTLPHAELNLPHDSIYHIYENRFKETPYIGKFDPVHGGYNTSRQPLASYAAMVTLLDKYVGEVIDELKKLGIDKRTIVIFTSDNGPHHEGGAQPEFFHSNGNLRGIKRDVYEGGIRVPMIAWCPGTIKEGKQTDQVSAFWDIMPTLAELTRQPLPVPTDGISLLPTLFSKGKQAEHPYLYWEFHELNGREALRAGDWKLIRQPVVGSTHTELYNLADDPGETRDLSGSQPEKLMELTHLMDSARVPSPLFDFGRENN